MALDYAVTIGDPMEGLFIDETDGATKTVAAKASAVILCHLTLLGRTDIVETLLSLGHSANGFTSEPRSLLDHGAEVNATVLPQQPNRSLLQILAERPKQNRNGIGIAQLLIAKGIPIDPITLPPSSSSTDNTTTQPLLLTPKSAFSSAVTRQDIPLADLLLTHGANIELVHMWNPIRPPTTVLGELICTPTERNLESISYLLNLPTPPSFIVSPSIKWSALLYSAMYFNLPKNIPATETQKRVLGQMVRRMLSKARKARKGNDEEDDNTDTDADKDGGELVPVYASEENLSSPHDIQNGLGGASAPFVAAIAGNYEVVTALIESVPDIAENPNKYFMHHNTGLTATLMLKILVGSFPNLPEPFNTALAMDKGSREEQIERYRLTLARLEEIQE
ncbi:hypothetical protein GYMLUDRAFT_55744 [Collybiopsis luxurians FD-317 M1]|nr:hypothetical protein GYMLUDRAFT_55744 [Collybiopsis luxurians FD-317 M1]